MYAQGLARARSVLKILVPKRAEGAGRFLDAWR